MTTFQSGDIIQDGDLYRNIYEVVGQGVFCSVVFSGVGDYDTSVHYFPISKTTQWEIVERDGKEYKEEKWIPRAGYEYYFPDISYQKLDYCCVWTDDGNDRWRLKNNLVFKTKEEAIERAKAMLKAKQGMHTYCKEHEKQKFKLTCLCKEGHGCPSCNLKLKGMDKDFDKLLAQSKDKNLE